MKELATDSEFNEFFEAAEKAGKTVLVDFFARK